MKRTFPTSNGTPTIITIREFVRLIPSQPASHNEMQFNTVEKMSDYSGLIDSLTPYQESNFMRRVVKLRKDKNSDKLMDRFLIGDVKRQAKKKIFKSKTSVANLFEQLVYGHAYNGGSAKYIVKVGSRRWMAADPEDFRVFASQDSVGLACLVRHRTVIYKVVK